ncbi:MAG: hypothetical protein J7M34_09010, partial [Anaerolineae bacterium]|nr:hypothetical protein [Anaerolineae bacterium]
DWRSTEPLEIDPEDILLGHPHYDQRTVVQRAFREAHCRAKFLIFPFHHGIPRINMPFDPLVRRCTRLFAITGEYWYNTVEQSPFAHWKEKMVRVDMAVDASRFPYLKRRFNPPGERVLFYLGTDAPEKGVAHLAQLVRDTGYKLVYAGYIGPSKPLFAGLNVQFLGPIELTHDRLR